MDFFFLLNFLDPRTSVRGARFRDEVRYVTLADTSFLSRRGAGRLNFENFPLSWYMSRPVLREVTKTDCDVQVFFAKLLCVRLCSRRVIKLCSVSYQLPNCYAF